MLAKILKQLDEKPEGLGIGELATLCERTVPAILAALATEPWGWWYVEQVAGPHGWIYRKRTLLMGYVPRVMRKGEDE